MTKLERLLKTKKDLYDRLNRLENKYATGDIDYSDEDFRRIMELEDHIRQIEKEISEEQEKWL